ncbi:hypothetical protein J4416_01925 [Candidatus Pacearchaeota archaeon]|nr:hypothetical protein [Candidatus Pacearchaeota archaeon]
MKKTLASLAFGAATLLGACSTPRFEMENNISGIKEARMTQRDAPFNYQTVKIAGTEYEVEEQTHVYFPDEEDFRLRSDMESTLWRNFSGKKARLESDEMMIPTRLYVNSEEEATVRIPATEIEFDTTGPYALKADITRPDGEEMGITNINEQLEKYGIETRIINGKPYAISVVLDDAKEEIKRVFIINTGEDAELGTRRSDGAISIRSTGIYELIPTKQSDYNSRPLIVKHETIEPLAPPLIRELTRTPSIREFRYK